VVLIGVSKYHESGNSSNASLPRQRASLCGLGIFFREVKCCVGRKSSKDEWHTRGPRKELSR